MRVRISVLGFLPIGLATVFVATFLAACGGGGGGGGTTLPPLSDNDLITRSAQQGSSTTAQATSGVRAVLRGIGTIAPQSRGRQSGQCPRVVDVDYQGDYFDGSTLYFDEAVATLDYGNGCTDEDGDYGRGVITVRMTNVEMDLEAVLSGDFEFGSDFVVEAVEISGQNFAWDPDMRPVAGYISIAVNRTDGNVRIIDLEYDLTTRYSSSCFERVQFSGTIGASDFVNWLFGDTYVFVDGAGSYSSPLTGTLGFRVDYTFRLSDDCPYPSGGSEVIGFRGGTARVEYDADNLGCGRATLTINNGSPITINLNNLAGINPCR